MVLLPLILYSPKSPAPSTGAFFTMVSPVKWLTDAQYQALPVNERAVAWADSQNGVKERGRNKGFDVEKYQEVAGLGKGGGFPWCACFVYWCLIKAGARSGNLPASGKVAAVRNWVAWATDNKRLISKPKRGCLFYWLHANDQGHIGFCISPMLTSLLVRTIEGNTDGEVGSREGDGVYKRTRTVASLRKRFRYGFIDISGL